MSEAVSPHYTLDVLVFSMDFSPLVKYGKCPVYGWGSWDGVWVLTGSDERLVREWRPDMKLVYKTKKLYLSDRIWHIYMNPLYEHLSASLTDMTLRGLM